MLLKRTRGESYARFVVAVAAMILVTACGPAVGSHNGAVETAAPKLVDVDPLAEPKDWHGVAHAGLPPVAIDPVATSPRPKLPVTVTDAGGTSVTITDVRRILALDVYGTLSQTVFELGLGDSVVGRDLSTQFPEATDLPLVTSAQGHDLIAEQILAVDPSVIITDTSLGPWDVILQMRDAGIPVVVVDSRRSLENLAALTLEVATALGVPAEGRALGSRIEEQARAVAEQIAAVAPTALEDKLRMAFLYVRGQSGVYYMFGEGSGAEGLIDALGGYDVAGEIGWTGMKPVTDEALIAAQPDLILMMTAGLESVGGIDGLLDRIPAIANTPAGEHERVVDMVDTGILSYGPRTAEVLNALAVAVYAPQALK